MKCAICEKNMLRARALTDAPICPKCYAKLPTIKNDLSYSKAVRLLEYKGPTEQFGMTYRIGKLALDEDHYLLLVGEKLKQRHTLSRYVYELRYIKQYSVDFVVKQNKKGDKCIQEQSIIGDIWLHLELIQPDMTISCIIKPNCKTHCWYDNERNICWELPHSVLETREKINAMIDNFLADKEERFLQTKQQIMLDQSDQVELEQAKAAFFLSDNYTKTEVKKQRALLLKTFHPDEGGTDAYAQKINQYYDVLIQNMHT